MSLTTNPTASTSTSTPTHQKRVLPSRTRRAGAQTGVGGHEIDLLILEEYKRPSIPIPIIPGDTPFIFAYDTSDLVGDGDTTTEDTAFFDVGMFDSYFGKESVKESCRKRQDIETPEFFKPEHQPVSGRFRPRQSDHVTLENTSDEAYEKRHNKFERFERQLRIREKEKLKHDQHKLLARLEQLRALDPSAFMSLQSSDFPLPPSTSSEDPSSSSTGIPGAHSHGAAAHTEGLRRRKIMLDVGARLEERYKVLLPPERKPPKAPRHASTSTSASAEPEAQTSKSSAVRPIRRPKKTADTPSSSSISVRHEDTDVNMTDAQDVHQEDKMEGIEETKPPPPSVKITIKLPNPKKEANSKGKTKSKPPPAKKRKLSNAKASTSSPPPSSARIIRTQPVAETSISVPLVSIPVVTSPPTPAALPPSTQPPSALPSPAQLLPAEPTPTLPAPARPPAPLTPTREPQPMADIQHEMPSPRKASSKKETPKTKSRSPQPAQSESSLVPAIATLELEEHEPASSPVDTNMEDEDNIDHLASPSPPPPPSLAVTAPSGGRKTKAKGNGKASQRRSVSVVAPAQESASTPITWQKQRYFPHDGSGRKATQKCFIREAAKFTSKRATKRVVNVFGVPIPFAVFADKDLDLAELHGMGDMVREREEKYRQEDGQ